MECSCIRELRGWSSFVNAMTRWERSLSHTHTHWFTLSFQTHSLTHSLSLSNTGTFSLYLPPSHNEVFVWHLVINMHLIIVYFFPGILCISAFWRIKPSLLHDPRAHILTQLVNTPAPPGMTNPFHKTTASGKPPTTILSVMSKNHIKLNDSPAFGNQTEKLYRNFTLDGEKKIKKSSVYTREGLGQESWSYSIIASLCKCFLSVEIPDWPRARVWADARNLLGNMWEFQDGRYTRVRECVCVCGGA